MISDIFYDGDGDIDDELLGNSYGDMTGDYIKPKVVKSVFRTYEQLRGVPLTGKLPALVEFVDDDLFVPVVCIRKRQLVVEKKTEVVEEYEKVIDTYFQEKEKDFDRACEPNMDDSDDQMPLTESQLVVERDVEQKLFPFFRTGEESVWALPYSDDDFSERMLGTSDRVVEDLVVDEVLLRDYKSKSSYEEALMVCEPLISALEQEVEMSNRVLHARCALYSAELALANTNKSDTVTVITEKQRIRNNINRRKRFSSRLWMRVARKRPNMILVQSICCLVRDWGVTGFSLGMRRKWCHTWSRIWKMFVYGMRKGFRNMFYKYGMPEFFCRFIAVLYNRCISPVMFSVESGRVMMLSEKGDQELLKINLCSFEEDLHDFFKLILNMISYDSYASCVLVSKGFHRYVTRKYVRRYDNSYSLTQNYVLNCKHEGFGGLEMNIFCKECYVDRKDQVFVPLRSGLTWLSLVGPLNMYEAECVWLSELVQSMSLDMLWQVRWRMDVMMLNGRRLSMSMCASILYDVGYRDVVTMSYLQRLPADMFTYLFHNKYDFDI